LRRGSRDGKDQVSEETPYRLPSFGLGWGRASRIAESVQI